MDSKPNCRNCYASGRCNCNRGYPPQVSFTSSPPTYPRFNKYRSYPKSSVTIRNEHSKQRVQSLYDTPCASVVSVEHILKPLRQAEREKWMPKYALTSTTGLSLDGLLCECCSPKGCRCPHKCPTCGQKVEEEIELDKKKSTFEKPRLCIACKRCRLDQKCFSRVIHPSTSKKSQGSQTKLKDPSVTNDSPVKKAPKACECDCRTKKSASRCPTPENIKSQQLAISENILKMLLAKRDESFFTQKSKKSKQRLNEDQSKQRFGAGSDRKTESESEELLTTNPVVSSSTDVVDTESSQYNASEKEEEKKVSKGPKKSIQRLKSKSKMTSSDEFKAFKKDYVVQELWGVSTDLGKSKYAQISTSKKYISPQTGRVFNLNQQPAIPKIEISDHVIPKPLSIHDLLLLSPRKPARSCNEKLSPSSFSDKIISSEYMALRGGTDKRKPRAQKNASDRFRFPNLNSLFSTADLSAVRKSKNSSYDLSEKSSGTSEDSNQDDFLEKQVEEVLQKKKGKVGLLAQCAGSISNKLANFEDMLRSQLSKDIFASAEVRNSRSSAGQDVCCSPKYDKNIERCKFPFRSSQKFKKNNNLPYSTFQKNFLNLDDMIKSNLSNLVLGRYPDICDIDNNYCSNKRTQRENYLNLPDINLPYIDCANKCRKFDDIVKSKLSSLILGRMPEVKLMCDKTSCDECYNSITQANSILYSNTGISDPLDITRLPCTNIPRALMRFDDIIKAKLSSAIVGTYMTPENCSPVLSRCSTPKRFSAGTSPTMSRKCDSTASPSPVRSLDSPSPILQQCLPQKSICKDCTTTPSPPCMSHTCSPKSSIAQSPQKENVSRVWNQENMTSSKMWNPPNATSSKIWNQPNATSSKTWSTQCSPTPNPKALQIPVTPYATVLQTCSRPITGNPFNVVPVNGMPFIPSICNISNFYDSRRKRPCSSFTSICTTKADAVFDLGLKASISNKPTCVRDFRGPKFDFSCNYNRKRYKSINNNKSPSTPVPLPCPFLQCCGNCCERPPTGNKSPTNDPNPYLDPNWRASCTDISAYLSAISSTCLKTSLTELCPKSSKTSFNLPTPSDSPAQCAKCTAQSNKIAEASGNSSPNRSIASKLSTYPQSQSPIKTPQCCISYMKNSSAPLPSPEPKNNPYMDNNWKSSPSMQCLGSDYSNDSLSPKCCETNNDRWCYYYSFEKSEDFVEYPPLPQDSYDIEEPPRKVSDDSIDTIFSAITAHKDSTSSNLTRNSSSKTLRPANISTAEVSTITDVEISLNSDNSKKELVASSIEDQVTTINEGGEEQEEDEHCIIFDDKVEVNEEQDESTSEKSDETTHSFYKNTIISYCFISDKPEAISETDIRDPNSETYINLTKGSSTSEEAKCIQGNECNSACVYQNDFIAGTYNKRDSAKDKFARAIEKICSLAKASTSFKQKSKQTSAKINIDEVTSANYSVSLTKEIYNIQLQLTRGVQCQEETFIRENRSLPVKRKCSSLLALNRKNSSTINVSEYDLTVQKDVVRSLEEASPSWKFIMKHAFPIIRGRVFPNYKPTKREKANKYIRLLKEISEFKDYNI